MPVGAPVVGSPVVGAPVVGAPVVELPPRVEVLSCEVPEPPELSVTSPVPLVPVLVLPPPPHPNPGTSPRTAPKIHP